jgi:hypothetical protein
MDVNSRSAGLTKHLSFGDHDLPEIARQVSSFARQIFLGSRGQMFHLPVGVRASRAFMVLGRCPLFD